MGPRLPVQTSPIPVGILDQALGTAVEKKKKKKTQCII